MSFGNKDINELWSFLNKFTVIDGSKVQERRYAYHLINKMKREFPKFVVIILSCYDASATSDSILFSYIGQNVIGDLCSEYMAFLHPYYILWLPLGYILK